MTRVRSRTRNQHSRCRQAPPPAPGCAQTTTERGANHVCGPRDTPQRWRPGPGRAGGAPRPPPGTRGHVRDHRALQPADRPGCDRLRVQRPRRHLPRGAVHQPDRAGLHRADIRARDGVLCVRADPLAGAGVRRRGDVPAPGPNPRSRRSPTPIGSGCCATSTCGSRRSSSRTSSSSARHARRRRPRGRGSGRARGSSLSRPPGWSRWSTALSWPHAPAWRWRPRGIEPLAVPLACGAAIGAAAFSLHERHHRRARGGYRPEAVDLAAIVAPPPHQAHAA